jgi:hypothetical protein
VPSSAVHTFTDPDDYGAKIRATTSEVTITGRGCFDAKHVCIDLHGLWMQRFSDNLPRIIHAACISGRAMIQFRTTPGPSLVWGGRDMRPTNIVRHSDGESTFQRSSGSASLGSMSLPLEDLATFSESMAKVDLTPPPDATMVAPPPTAMARLQRLHAAAASLAETAPEIIANPDAARGLEQALIEAMVDCLASGDVR